MPVINLPAFAGAHGMPIGVSLVAGRFHDQHLLTIAQVLSGPLMAQGGWYGGRSAQKSAGLKGNGFLKH